jgi:hypothetical protein
MNSTSVRPVPTLASRVNVNEDVLFQELQGEAVLLHLNSGMYFGLDPVGTRMWQLLIEHGQLTEVVRAMVTEFEVSEERCAADLLLLVVRLEDQGLVTVAAQQ